MRAELGYTKEQCTKFFPALQELSDISREFLARLRKRQSDETPIIEHFADVLYDFWNSGNIYEIILSKNIFNHGFSQTFFFNKNFVF